METIYCDCGNRFKPCSFKSHLKSKRHLQYLYGPSKFHFDYFKCDCGSYIKKDSIYMHRLTDVHKYYIATLMKDNGYETDDKLNVYLE
jgi:hypothetical protein